MSAPLPHSASISPRSGGHVATHVLLFSRKENHSKNRQKPIECGLTSYDVAGRQIRRRVCVCVRVSAVERPTTTPSMDGLVRPLPARVPPQSGLRGGGLPSWAGMAFCSSASRDRNDKSYCGRGGRAEVQRAGGRGGRVPPLFLWAWFSTAGPGREREGGDGRGGSPSRTESRTRGGVRPVRRVHGSRAPLFSWVRKGPCPCK